MLFSFISKALISLHSREKNLSSLHFIFDHCRQTSISTIAIRLFFRSLLLIFPFWQFSLNTSLCHYRSALHIPFSHTSPSDFHFGHCRWKPLLVFVNLHNPFISAISANLCVNSWCDKCRFSLFSVTFSTGFSSCRVLSSTIFQHISLIFIFSNDFIFNKDFGFNNHFRL